MGHRSRRATPRGSTRTSRAIPTTSAKAKALLAGIGLADRNKNGVVEDEKGTEARFTVITQRGLGWYERGLQVIGEGAKQIGVAFDVAPLENGAMIQRMLACDFDAIYMRVLARISSPRRISTSGSALAPRTCGTASRRRRPRRGRRRSTS